MVHTLLELGALSDLARDVRAGLTRPGQKELPSKYFYDDAGSRYSRRSPCSPNTA
jgi:uncharacterized SAM-dependent methyltransferase